MLSGNAVYLIDVDLDGAITLRPASDFKVSGSPRRLSYQLEMATPNTTGQPVLRRASSDGVIHVMVNEPPGSPWQGRAPWQCANLSAEALERIERSLKQDSSVPGGMLLPLPDGLSTTAKNHVVNAVIRGQGGITPIETTAGGFGAGNLAAPKADYEEKRFGAMVPEPNLKMRDSTSLAILRSYGVSPKVLDGDGNAMREARRALFLDTILPLTAVVSQELSEKLDSNISLDFNPSQYRDFQRLSRSLKTFIDAGLSLGQASSLLGINLSEGTPPPLGAGRQAAAVSGVSANGEVNVSSGNIGTPIDTPQIPPDTPQRSAGELMVKHLQSGVLIKEHDSTEPCELCRVSGSANRGSTNGRVEHATLD